MNPQLALALPASTVSTAVIINGRVTLRVEGEQRVLWPLGSGFDEYRVFYVFVYPLHPRARQMLSEGSP